MLADLRRLLPLLVFICLGVALPSSSPLAQELPDIGTRGWYVIISSHSFRPGSDGSQRRAEAAVEREAARLRATCGVRSKTAVLMSSEDFNPNVAIVYRGAYARREQAESVRDEVRGCRPDAYIKFGSFIVVH